MSELPADVERLRQIEAWLLRQYRETATVGRYLEVQIGRVQEAIAAASGGRSADAEPGMGPGHGGGHGREPRGRRGGPPAGVPVQPEWVLEVERLSGAARTPVRVHAGDCGQQGAARSLSREEAVRALREGVGPCPFCRPELRLGISVDDPA
ncbi:DUF6233 domain-containing protein [Streptomyces sp. NPDC059740]|uniref:DUF6233 domain-containing protein n=1 Tax=Streptomyces sp. NPDC059740 TaxID=3346926 RepID=UPI00365737BB